MNDIIILSWLVVSTPLKNISQIGSSSQLLGKIKNLPKHQPVNHSWLPIPPSFINFRPPQFQLSQDCHAVHAAATPSGRAVLLTSDARLQMEETNRKQGFYHQK
jgi:hypothetical protein